LLKRFILYITLFWSFASQAQYLSVRGDFSIDQRRSCRDLLVTVTNINPGTDVILYQYEGKSSQVTANTSFLYTTTGNFWLYQYIQGPGGQKEDSIFVEIFDPVIPDFELQTCNNLDVQVVLQNNDYDIYEIDYGDGSIIQVPVNTFPPVYSYGSATPVNVTVTGLYTTATNRCGTRTLSFTPVNQVQPAQLMRLTPLDNQTLVVNYNLAPNTKTSLEVSLNNTSNFQLFKSIAQGTTTDTLTNLQLNISTYCFRITSHDACSNARVYSNNVCSIFADIQAVNNAIDLNWKTVFPADHQAIVILRDSASLISLVSQPLNYTDSSVTCNTNYCYIIESQSTGGAVSRSNVVCDLAFSNDAAEPVKDISAGFNTSEIVWSWLTPVNEQAQVFKVFNQNESLLAQTTNNSLTTNFNEEFIPCIKIQLTNICGNISAMSSIVCPVELKSTLNGDGSTTLSWSAYTGWANGVNNYSIVIYDRNMNVLDSLDVGNTTEYIDPLPANNNQVNYYKVWANPVDTGIVSSNSWLIKVERPPVIAIPSSFTPNNDNLNDVFVISGKFIESVELTILNRWGSTIYHVNGSTWDGTSNGKKVPLDTYVYTAVIKDFAGNTHIRSGTVLILKD
jgi:gliding motility-associated-like protein